MNYLLLALILFTLPSCTNFRWTGKGNGPPDDPECYYSKDDPKYKHYPCPNDSAAAGTSPGFVESHHPNEVELDKKYFVVSYNPKHRLPNWVSYKLGTFHVSTKAGKRKDKFFVDPELVKRKLAYAKPTDFDGKIYDRGHLAPSEDIVWSQEANDATFVMSNMTPQKRALNRGSWKKLEAKVRGWACTEKELTVVSGPFLTDDLPKFKSGVSIPRKFFKIIIDETAPRKAVALPTRLVLPPPPLFLSNLLRHQGALFPRRRRMEIYRLSGQP